MIRVYAEKEVIMKKIISLLLAAVLLISLCTVTAFAQNGPMEDSESGMGGGARAGFSSFSAPEVSYVVINKVDGLEIDNTAFAGATYDKASNTLTLTDVDAADRSLFIWYMGDDFRLRVEGDCRVGVIYVYDQFGVYNTNLNITGTGSLTVNEDRQAEYAIGIWSEGEDVWSRLAIDDSVTLHLYAAEDGEDIICNMYTGTTDAAEAISVGGKGIEGVVRERATYTEYDEANLMIVSGRGTEYEDGYAAKSKSDPDGRYAVSFWEENGSRYVRHYVYVSELGMWAADPTFGEYSTTKTYTKEEFEQEYTIEQSSQPTKIRFATDEREQNRGWEVTTMEKTDDPDAVYGANALWSGAGSYDEEPDSYLIYRLIRDEEQGVYVKDEDFGQRHVDASDLEAEGFRVVTETTVQNRTFRCWAKPAPYDDENWTNDYDIMSCKSDPDSLYVRIGESYTVNDDGERVDRKAMIQKVQYDAENDVYHVDTYGTSIHIPFEELGEDFDYVTEEVTVPKMIRYISADYNFNSYSDEALLAGRTGDTSPYAVETYTAYGETHYSVYRVELRDNGHYYAVKFNSYDDDVYGQDMSLEKFEEEGYYFEMSDKDMPFTHDGNVRFETFNRYTDDEGNLYGVDYWLDEIFGYSEDGQSVTFGDTTYYMANPSELSADELISSEREVETDFYHYILKGSEYHHEGGGEPQVTVLLGDADDDGKVTILDATAIQRTLANLSTTAFNDSAADADQDSKITILDATAIQRHLANLSTNPNIGKVI